ncbi:hypothetical protein D9M72_344250 [compost metagenome]
MKLPSLLSRSVPYVPWRATPTFAAKPSTAETVCPSPESGSMSLVRTLPLAGLGDDALLVSSLTEAPSATATGASLVPMTEIFTVVVDEAPWLSAFV